MKKFIKVLLPILAIVIMCTSLFMGCSKKIETKEKTKTKKNQKNEKSK